MSSSKCQCLFSEPADTIRGSHRDPITSEKCWLDFFVRELSRIAADKGRGQEAVWGRKCQPTWWDSECPNHEWKNPTANPKDSKSTLEIKFQCLEKHLRKEGKIPRELEDKIKLWNDGNMEEMCFMTLASCILGQVSNLHHSLKEARLRMEQKGLTINNSILNDISKCLDGCKHETQQMQEIYSRQCQLAEKHANVLATKPLLKRQHKDLDAERAAKRPKIEYNSFSSTSTSSTESSSFPSSSASSPPMSLASQPVLVASDTPPLLDVNNKVQVLARLQSKIQQKSLGLPFVQTPRGSKNVLILSESKSASVFTPKSATVSGSYTALDCQDSFDDRLVQELSEQGGKSNFEFVDEFLDSVLSKEKSDTLTSSVVAELPHCTTYASHSTDRKQTTTGINTAATNDNLTSDPCSSNSTRPNDDEHSRLRFENKNTSDVWPSARFDTNSPCYDSGSEEDSSVRVQLHHAKVVSGSDTGYSSDSSAPDTTSPSANNFNPWCVSFDDNEVFDLEDLLNQ